MKTKKKTNAKKTTKKVVEKTAAAPSVNNGTPAGMPSLEDIGRQVRKIYYGVTSRNLRLGELYVKTIAMYGKASAKALYRSCIPINDNKLNHLELVGQHKLLPHFLLCSDKFINGLVNMKDSMTWQMRLTNVSSGKNGTSILVEIDGKLIEKDIRMLSDSEEDYVLSIMSESDLSQLTIDQLADKIRNMHSEVRAKFPRKKKSPYVIKMSSEGKYVVRFMTKVGHTLEELKAIVSELEAKAAEA